MKVLKGTGFGLYQPLRDLGSASKTCSEFPCRPRAFCAALLAGPQQNTMGAVYVIYNLLLAVALLASAPYWLVRLLRQGKYREGLGNRLGIVPPHLRSLAAAGKPVIWVHAVSVGEILAVAGLIQEMRKRFGDYAIAISTTTSTGHKLADDRFGPENVFFFPLDLSFAVQRYMRLLRPRLVVIAETEFWPNFLRAARLSGAAVAVVNARISDRSYPRYRKFAFLPRIVLRSVDRFLAQTEEDARRHDQPGPAGRRRRPGRQARSRAIARPVAGTQRRPRRRPRQHGGRRRADAACHS